MLLGVAGLNRRDFFRKFVAHDWLRSKSIKRNYKRFLPCHRKVDCRGGNGAFRSTAPNIVETFPAFLLRPAVNIPFAFRTLECASYSLRRWLHEIDCCRSSRLRDCCNAASWSLWSWRMMTDPRTLRKSTALATSYEQLTGKGTNAVHQAWAGTRPS
jgi:hypothetical protein